MKKIVLFILLVACTKTSFSQIDMLSALKTIGEDVVYTEYCVVTVKPNEKNDIAVKRYVVTLKPALNRFGKVAGFDGIDTKDEKEKRIKYFYMHGWFDHYTHPSYYIQPDSRTGYVILNGVIIKLEKFESISSFQVSGLWFPKVPKSKSGEALFQGSSMSDFKSANLEQIIKDYFITALSKRYGQPLETGIIFLQHPLQKTVLCSYFAGISCLSS